MPPECSKMIGILTLSPTTAARTAFSSAVRTWLASQRIGTRIGIALMALSVCSRILGRSLVRRAVSYFNSTAIDASASEVPMDSAMVVIGGQEQDQTQHAPLRN